MIVDPKVIIKLFNEYLEGDSKKVKGDYSSFEAFIASRKGKKEPYFDGYAKADSIDLTKLAKTVDGDYNADDIVNKKYAELLVYLAKEPPLTVRNTKVSLTEYIRPLLSALITKEAYLNIKPVDKAVIATESKKTENAYVTFISTEDVEKLNELLTTTGNGMLRTNEKIRKTKPWAKFWTVFRKYLLPPVLVGGASATAGWLTTMFVQAGTNILWTGSVAGTALSFGAIGVAGTLGVIGAVKVAKAFTRLYYERKYGRTAKKNDTFLNELNEFDTEHITSYDDLVKTAGALPIVKLMELIRKKDELILKRRGIASWLNPLTRTMNRNRLHELMRYKQKLAEIDAADPSYSKLKLLEKHLDTFLLANMENYFKQTRRTKNKAKFQNADIEAKHVMHSKKLVDVRSYINKRLAEIASLHVFGASADPTLIVEAADMRKVQKTEGKTSKKTKKAAKPEVKKDKPVKHKVNGKTLYVKDGNIYTDEECKTITTDYNLNKKGKPIKITVKKSKAEETEIDKILKEIDVIIAFNKKNEKEISKMTNSERVDYYEKLIAAKRKLLQEALLSGKFDGEDKKLVLATFQKSVEEEIADLENKRKEAAAKLSEEELIEVRTLKLGLLKSVKFKFNKSTGKVESVITAGYTSTKYNGEVGWISKDNKYFIDNKGNVTVVSDEFQNGLRTITVAGAKREIKYKYKTDDGSVLSITTPGFTVKTYEGEEGWISKDGRVFISKDAKTKIIPLKKVTADDKATLYLNETTNVLYTDEDGTKLAKEYFLEGENVLAVWEVKVVKDEAEKVAYNRKTKKFYKEDKKTILTDIELVGGEFVRITISALIEKTYGTDKVWVDPTSKKVYKDNAGKAGDELTDLTYNGTEVVKNVKTRRTAPKETVEEQETTVKAKDGTMVKVKAKVKLVKGRDPEIVKILEVLTAGYKLNDKGEVVPAKTTTAGREKMTTADGKTVWVDKATKIVYTTQKGSKVSTEYYFDGTNIVAIWVEQTVEGTTDIVYYNNQTKKIYTEKDLSKVTDKYVRAADGKITKKPTTSSKRVKMTTDDGKIVWVNKANGKVYTAQVGNVLAKGYTYDNANDKVTKVVVETTEERETTTKAKDGTVVKVRAKVKVVGGVEKGIVEILEVLTAGYKLDKGEIVKVAKRTKKAVVKTETKEGFENVDGVDVKVEVEITTTDGVETNRVIKKVLTAGYKLNDKGEVVKEPKKSAKSTLKRIVADDSTVTWVDVDKKTVYLDEEGKTETKEYLYTGTKVVYYMQQVTVKGEAIILFLNLKDRLLYTDRTGSTLARDFVFDAITHEACRIVKDESVDFTYGTGASAVTIKIKVDNKGNILDIVTAGYTKGVHESKEGWFNPTKKKFICVDKKVISLVTKKAKVERNEIDLAAIYGIAGAKLDLNSAEVLLANKKVYYFNPRTGNLQNTKPSNLILPLSESDVAIAVEKYNKRKNADKGDEDSDGRKV